MDNEFKSLFPVHDQDQLAVIRAILDHDPNARITIQGPTAEIHARIGDGEMHAKFTPSPLGGKRDVRYTLSHTHETQSDFEQTVMERLQSGQTQKSVADEMGISQSRVSQIKQKHTK